MPRNAERNASQRHLVHGKARELDREHDISGKVMEAGSKAESIMGSVRISIAKGPWHILAFMETSLK